MMRMSEDNFWNIINSVCGASSSISIIEKLVKLSPEEIISFALQLRAQIACAYTPDMLRACFIICSYISDDTFTDFRTWIVFQGFKKFTSGLRDAETISEWLLPTEIKQIGRQWILVPQKAYMLKTNSGIDSYLDIFYSQSDLVFDPTIDFEWPDKLDELRSFLPKLYDLFWNPRRIEELHSGKYLS